MKILFLGDPVSPHIIKWANILVKNTDYEIFLWGLRQPQLNEYDERITLQFVKLDNKVFSKPDGYISKLFYLKYLSDIKSFVREISPDIIHAHYASSYGLLGALLKFHPLIISVWGADVFNFPDKSPFHRMIFSYNMKKADRILSTSIVMAQKVKTYTEKNITVIPFGIDLEIFKPFKVKRIFDENNIVIGTVKSLEKKYGIDYLIKSFKVVKERNPFAKIKLLIIGGGSQEMELKNLASKLLEKEDYVFTGAISYSEIAHYHNMIDIEVFTSIEDSESFGVSVLEASACERPVVVTNVGGLPEVVRKDETGIIVQVKNVDSIANAVEVLVLNSKYREDLGKAGRQWVASKYNINECVKDLISVYKSV